MEAPSLEQLKAAGGRPAPSAPVLIVHYPTISSSKTAELDSQLSLHSGPFAGRIGHPMAFFAALHRLLARF